MTFESTNRKSGVVQGRQIYIYMYVYTHMYIYIYVAGTFWYNATVLLSDLIQWL